MFITTIKTFKQKHRNIKSIERLQCVGMVYISLKSFESPSEGWCPNELVLKHVLHRLTKTKNQKTIKNQIESKTKQSVVNKEGKEETEEGSLEVYPKDNIYKNLSSSMF